MNKKVVISNVIWKIMEKSISQIVSIVITIILAKLLVPNDYGLVSIVTAFINVSSVIVESGISTALIQKKEVDEVDYYSVLYFNLFISLVLFILIFFFAPAISSYYDNDILCQIARVMAIRPIIASISSVQYAYISKNMMFKKYFLSTSIGTIVSGLIGIVMAIKNYGVWSLVIQNISNTIINVVILSFSINIRPKKVFNFLRIVQLIKYGWKILFESFSDTFMNQFQSLVIGKVYSSSDLAYYSKGQQFPTIIINNISSSIGDVLFPVISTEQNDSETILRILRYSIRISSYVLFPMLFGLAVVSMSFVKTFLNDSWLGTVPYLQLFCLISIATVGFIPRHQAIKGIGRSDVFMNEHIVGRIVMIVLLYATYKKGIIAFSLSNLIGTLFLSLILLYTSFKYNNYSIKDQLLDVMPSFFGCLIMSVPVYLIYLLKMPSSITLIIQIITGSFVYYLYSVLTESKEYYICKALIVDFLHKIKRQ